MPAVPAALPGWVWDMLCKVLSSPLKAHSRLSCFISFCFLTCTHVINVVMVDSTDLPALAFFLGAGDQGGKRSGQASRQQCGSSSGGRGHSGSLLGRRRCGAQPPRLHRGFQQRSHHVWRRVQPPHARAGEPHAAECGAAGSRGSAARTLAGAAATQGEEEESELARGRRRPGGRPLLPQGEPLSWPAHADTDVCYWLCLLGAGCGSMLLLPGP